MTGVLVACGWFCCNELLHFGLVRKEKVKTLIDSLTYSLLHSSFVVCETLCASIAYYGTSFPCQSDRDAAVLIRLGHAGLPRDKTLLRMQIRWADKDLASQRTKLT